jgi:hypothetical protein
MLLDQTRPGAGGRVAILTRNPALNRVLAAILEEWHYLPVDSAAECDILLIERGLTLPAGVPRVLWLTPMPVGAEPHLLLPFSLVDLYHYLEPVFFAAPRRHIRLTLNQPVDLNVRGVWLVGRLLSLSDRGARIACPATLPKGENVILDFKVGGYPLRTTAEVLYDVPAGDTQGREQPQAGLMLNSFKPGQREALRRFIARSYVEQACARTGIDINDPGLSWFDLVKNPWGELAD